MTEPRTLDQILTEWFDILDRLDHLNTAKTRLQEEMRHLGEGHHQASNGTITISAPTRRFNPDKALEALPPEMVTLCQETIITSTRAKQMLPPALYDACSMPVGQPRVTVKPA